MGCYEISREAQSRPIEHFSSQITTALFRGCPHVKKGNGRLVTAGVVGQSRFQNIFKLLVHALDHTVGLGDGRMLCNGVILSRSHQRYEMNCQPTVEVTVAGPVRHREVFTSKPPMQLLLPLSNHCPNRLFKMYLFYSTILISSTSYSLKIAYYFNFQIIPNIILSIEVKSVCDCTGEGVLELLYCNTIHISNLKYSLIILKYARLHLLAQKQCQRIIWAMTDYLSVELAPPTVSTRPQPSDPCVVATAVQTCVEDLF